jgi:hypothetical protein
MIRALAIGLLIALVVFALSEEHVIFLPLLFIPFGLLSLDRRRRNRRGF